MVEFIFATHNQHKVYEVQKIMNPLKIGIRSLLEIGFKEDINETGTSFRENAKIKADHVYHALAGNVFGEDSGIEVEALNGEPGIFSARYAGPDKGDQANLDKLLSKLGNNSNRKARFVCHLAVWFGDKFYAFDGSIAGHIALQRMGSGGFGYDPIFIPVGYQQSFGQLSEKTKNTISHRTIAFGKFKFMLKNNLQEA